MANSNESSATTTEGLPSNLSHVQDTSDPSITKGNSEAFKQELDQKHWLQAFSEGIHEAITLKVITVVETPSLSDNGSGNKPIDLKGQRGHRLYTQINLIDGTVSNVFGQAFLNDPSYQTLMDFHKSQVLKGEQIIQANIESVKKIIDYAIQFGKELD